MLENENKNNEKNDEKNKYYANYSNISSEFLLDFREQFLKENDPSYGPTKINARYQDKEQDDYNFDKKFTDQENSFYDILKKSAGVGLASLLTYHSIPPRGAPNRFGAFLPNNNNVLEPYDQIGFHGQLNQEYQPQEFEQEQIQPPINDPPPPYQRIENIQNDVEMPSEITTREPVAEDNALAIINPSPTPMAINDINNIEMINDVVPSNNVALSSTNKPFIINKILQPTTNDELNEEALENTSLTNGQLFKPTDNIKEIKQPSFSLALQNFENVINNKSNLMEVDLNKPINKALLKETEFIKTDQEHNLYLLEKMGYLGTMLSTTSFAVLTNVLSSGFDATKMTAEYALEFAKIITKGTAMGLDETEKFLEWFLPKLATNGPKFIAKHTYDFYKMATFQDTAMFVTGVSLLTSIFIKLAQRQMRALENGIDPNLNGMFGEQQRNQFLQGKFNAQKLNYLNQLNQENYLFDEELPTTNALLREAQLEEAQRNLVNAVDTPRISGKTKLITLGLAFSIFASYYGDALYVEKNMNALKQAFKYSCWNLGLDPSNEENFETSILSFMGELKDKAKDFIYTTLLDDEELQDYHDSKATNYSIAVPNYSTIEFNKQLQKIQTQLLSASSDGIQVSATEIGEYVRNPFIKHENLINTAQNLIETVIFPIIAQKYLQKSNNDISTVLTGLGGVLMKYTKDQLLYQADHTPELYNTYMQMDAIGNQIKKVQKLDEIVYKKLNNSMPMNWDGEEEVRKVYGLDSFQNPFEALQENINYLSNAYYSHTKDIQSFGNFYSTLKHLKDNQINSNTVEISLKDFMLNAPYANYYEMRDENEIEPESNNLLRQVKKIVISFDALLSTNYLQGKDANEIETIYNTYHDEVFYMLKNINTLDPIATSNEITLAQTILANFLNFLVFEQKRLKDPSKYSRWADWFFNPPHLNVLSNPEFLKPSDVDFIPKQKRYQDAARDFGKGVENPYKDDDNLQKIFALYKKHKLDNLIEKHKYLMEAPKVGNGLLTKLPKIKNKMKSTLEHFKDLILNKIPKNENKIIDDKELVNCSNCNTAPSIDNPLMGHEKDTNDLLCDSCLNNDIRSGKGETKRTTQWSNINSSPNHIIIHNNHMLHRKQKDVMNKDQITQLDKFKQSMPKEHENIMEELGKGYSQSHDLVNEDKLTSALGSIFHSLPQHINNNHKANTYSMMIKFADKHKNKPNKMEYLKHVDFKDHSTLKKAINENPHSLTKHLL